MQIDIQEILSNPDPHVHDELASSFHSMTSADIAKALISASHSYDANVMGWFILPLLKERLATDPSLFNELLRGVSDPSVMDAYQAPVLNVLDKIAWKNGGSQWESYCHSLRSLVETPSIHASLSVRAIRLLARQNNTLTHDTFKAVAQSNTPDILDAMGEVITLWSRKKEAVPDTIVQRLITFAEMNPSIALRLPGLLRDCY